MQNLRTDKSITSSFHDLLVQLDWCWVISGDELSPFGVSERYFKESSTVLKWCFRENEKDVCCVKTSDSVQQAFNELFASRLAERVGVRCPKVLVALYRDNFGGIRYLSSSPLLGTSPRTLGDFLTDMNHGDDTIHAFVRQEISTAAPFQMFIRNSDWHRKNVICSEMPDRDKENKRLLAYHIDHVQLEWGYGGPWLYAVQDVVEAGCRQPIDLTIMNQTVDVISTLNDVDIRDIAKECMSICHIPERGNRDASVPSLDTIVRTMGERRDELRADVNCEQYMAERCWMKVDEYRAAMFSSLTRPVAIHLAATQSSAATVPV